jgi:hypothetical protein
VFKPVVAYPTTLTPTKSGYLDAAVSSRASVAEILTGVVEGTTTFVQAVRLLLAALTGKSSGLGTATVTVRDIGDTKNRIVATVDASGNRTAIGTRDGA